MVILCVIKINIINEIVYILFHPKISKKRYIFYTNNSSYLDAKFSSKILEILYLGVIIIIAGRSTDSHAKVVSNILENQ